MAQHLGIRDKFFSTNKDIVFAPAKPTGNALKKLRAKKKRQRQGRKTK